MINLRVDDFEGFMQKMRTAGVEVEEKTIEWEGGKHGWIRDLDGTALKSLKNCPLPKNKYTNQELL